MDKPILRTFKLDRILRNSEGVPIGRAVLVGEYEPDKDIPMAIMEVFVGNLTEIKTRVFYVDGNKYKVPNDFPTAKITKSKGKLLLNNFFLRRQD